MTLCLVLAATAYVAITVSEELELSQFSSLWTKIEQLSQESLAHAVIVLGILGCLMLLLGAVRPLRGGKGYDYKVHEAVNCRDAIVRSIQKMATLFHVVFAAGGICFRLLADALALMDLYEDHDIVAFSIKLLMIGLAASWAAMWVISPHTHKLDVHASLGPASCYHPAYCCHASFSSPSQTRQRSLSELWSSCIFLKS